MKKFWKILGLGALAAGLTPYKVEKNEETGENSYQALLWRITSTPSEEEGEKRRIDINLGEGTLTSRLMEAMDRKDEPHLFSDELSVEYHTADAVDIAETVITAGEAAGTEEEAAAAAGEAAEATDAANETADVPADAAGTETAGE